jgi:HSP20 family protein
MSLVTYNPFSLLNDLQRDMNRLFDHRLTQNGSSVARADWAPTVDVHEDDSGYHFAVDLPGVRREDLEVTAHNGVLSIRGERKAVHEDKKLQRSERFQGTFLREFSMPENADLDAIQAKCQDGVLAIFVPKAATAQPKRIEIQ